MDSVPLCIPHLTGREWEYVKECLDTNWLSYLGPFVDRFEELLARETGATRVVATNSGTAALHVALQIAGVTPDSEVILPDLTFVAPANAVRYCGAWPTFVDISAADWQLDVDKLARFLSEECVRERGEVRNRQTGRRISALLPVHVLGGICDVDGVAALATQFDLPVVEDAAECLGARYKGRPAGAPTPSIDDARRLICTSFNGNKIITTGGGGAILANDDHLADRARHLTTTAKADPIEFFHDEVGYNYRLTNVAAAIGVAQLEELTAYVDAKRATARAYGERLADLDDVTLHPEPPDCRSTFWLYSILVGRRSRGVVDSLIAQGISSRPLWKPMHLLPAFRDCHAYECDVATRVAEQGLSLPCSVGISDAEIDRVAEALTRALTGA